MIEAFRKIWRFAGNETKNINRSVAVSFLNALLQMTQVGAIYCVVRALTGGERSGRIALIALALELISIFGGAVASGFSKMLQTHAGYFMAADRRVAIADRLKSVPMGFFNANSLGQVAGVCTTVVGGIEGIVGMVLVNILSGLITTAVFAVMILFFDWHIGLIAIIGIALYFAVVSAMEKKSVAIAEGTQRSQTALENSRAANLEVEQILTPYTTVQEAVLQIAGVAMMLAAILLWKNGAMTLPNALMTLIVSFMVFSQIRLFGMGVSMLRMTAASIARAVETGDMPRLDEKGRAISPEKHDIVFDHESFSYEKKPILKDVSVTLRDRSTTAIVGPSGSGKTTFCNLIARFWDVDRGSIRIGGSDVRDYTLESLMDQISIVFQNVYLFADTIENNIKFGCPNATHAQVVEAAKKACCDDFIESLPKGYETVIGEGGASLSGGEKQRISIARAMLKDAPIVILDEATANVDPENEDRLQRAIEALTGDKTIIMIAHRLKTVKNADQILVIDHGEIVQQGRHETLINQKGVYADFVGSKRETVDWKLK